MTLFLAQGAVIRSSQVNIRFDFDFFFFLNKFCWSNLVFDGCEGVAGYVELAGDRPAAVVWEREGAAWGEVYELDSREWDSRCDHYRWVISFILFFNC